MNTVVVVEADAVVATMSRARAALAEAKTIQETKRIVDAAAAAEIYARRQKLGEEASDLALSIKIEALRKLGEMLQASPRAQGTRTLGGGTGAGGSVSVPPAHSAPTLAELGLTKKESAVAQKLAALPESEFQQVRDGHVTVAKAIAAVDAAKASEQVGAKPRKQAEPKQAEPATESYGPSAEEIAEAEASVRDDAERVLLILESDDALAEMTAKCKQLQAQVRILTARIAELTNANAEHVRSIKRLRSKLDKLEVSA